MGNYGCNIHTSENLGQRNFGSTFVPRRGRNNPEEDAVNIDENHGDNPFRQNRFNNNGHVDRRGEGGNGGGDNGGNGDGNGGNYGGTGGNNYRSIGERPQ